MARSSIATDDFNRASLGANWTNVNPASGTVSINASTAFISGGVGFANQAGAALWAGAGTFTADQYSSVVFVDSSFGSASYGVGVICRASTDTDAGRDYYAFMGRTNNTGHLAKVVNGTLTTLNDAAVTWANGDRVELECEGTTIRAMRNGVALGGAWTVTDSSLTTGKPGVLASGNDPVARGDNWEGGNLTAGAANWGPLLAGQINQLVMPVRIT